MIILVLFLVSGILKGYDKLDNVVLDDCIEYLRGLFIIFIIIIVINLILNIIFLDPSDPYKLTDRTRNLGLVVCRGTQLSFLSPVEGVEEIANPFTDEVPAEEEIRVQT